MENPTFRRAPDGTLLLTASPVARALGLQQPAGGQTSDRAKTPEEVDAEAWAHVASEGGDTNNATLVLSRWKVQFGRYQGKTFHWLLENDVGYSVNLVASHQKERERTGSQSPLMANKDAFTRYSSAYPDFVEAVGFHRAFEESRVRSLQPGQEGQALVGFGDFKFETLQSLYESEDSQKIRFVNYLRRKAPAPGTQMENAVRYIKSRDRQRAAGAAASSTTAATSTTSSSSSSSSSTASVPAAMKAKSALQFAAFVSGQRSPSAVEMQAKVKKLVPLRPAFPASSRPALPSTSSAFKPSDKELVTAVVDIKESSDVQAPLLLCPYPPPPATAAAAATSIASSAAAAAAATAATSAAAAAAATSAAAAAAATSAATAAATTAAATSAAAPAAAASRAAAVAAASAATASAAAASAAATSAAAAAAAAAATSAAAAAKAAAKAAAATGPSSSNVVFFFLYQPQPGPSSQGLPPMLPSPPPSTTRTLARAALPHPLPVAQRVPRTTAFRKRKAAEAVAAGVACPPTKARQQSGQYTCSRCGKPKRIETGHTRIAGVSYCATVGGKTVEEWREEMKKKKKEGQVLFLK